MDNYPDTGGTAWVRIRSATRAKVGQNSTGVDNVIRSMREERAKNAARIARETGANQLRLAV